MKRFLLIAALFIAGMGVQAQGCFVPSVHPAIIAKGQQATYAVYSSPGAGYNWTVSKGLRIMSGQGTNTCVVKNISACTGFVRVNRLWSNPCTATQNITDGTVAPGKPAFVNVITSPCNYIMVNVPSVSGATGYNVYVDGIKVSPFPYTTTYYASSYPHIMNNGTHTVCAEAYNCVGTSSQRCVTYTISGCGSGGGIAIYPKTAASPEAAEEQLTISPNPVSNYVLIEVDTDTQLEQMQVFDLQGKAVLTDVVPNERVEVSQLAPGTYFIQAVTQSGHVLTGKFQKY